MFRLPTIIVLLPSDINDIYMVQTNDLLSMDCAVEEATEPPLIGCFWVFPSPFQVTRVLRVKRL